MPRPRDRDHSRRRTSARLTGALLLLSAVAYTAWVLEVVFSTGLDPVRAYVSELAAEDQPLGGVFRATDLVAGIAVLAGAVAAVVGLERRPWAVAGWWLLAVFGAATVADSRLPLSCAPTSDKACAARETAGLVPATHAAHAVSSGLAMVGALGALTMLAVAARRYGWWAPFGRLGPWLLVAELAATGWSLAAIAAFEAGWGTWALGAGQRLQVVLVAVWLAVLARGVSRVEHGGRATAPGSRVESRS